MRSLSKTGPLRMRDRVRLAVPEPEVFKAIGEESRRRGTSALNSRQIDLVIKAARATKAKRG